jgi:sugar O-acyltransferase (sialic acid O-acetyltransferase NeuD family)
MPDLLLIGASGLAREVASAVPHGAWRVIGLLDDDSALHGANVGGLDVLGGIESAAGRDESLLVCVGDGSVRREIVDRLADLGVGDDRFATFVDETVRIPATVSVGVGSILLAGSVLTADLVLGRHVVLMPGVVLTHDDRVGDYVTIAAGVVVGGFVALGAESYLGMNASVRQRTTIGAGAVVGMGAAVLTDIPDGETWAGVPARRLQTTRREGPQ